MSPLFRFLGTVCWLEEAVYTCTQPLYCWGSGTLTIEDLFRLALQPSLSCFDAG